MKKWPTLAVAAGLLASALTATEAAAADPAPTNVQISWKDNTFQFVHVTWDEEAANPNRIVLRKQGGTVEKVAWHVTAGEPDEFDLPKDVVSQVGSINGSIEIGVAVGTEAAGETSPVAVSKAFDTIDAGTPRIVSFAPSGTSTLHVGWQAGAPVRKDNTPNDPLDRSAPVIFHPVYKVGAAASVPAGQPTTGTELTFTGPKPPFNFYVMSENEWFTGQPSDWVSAKATAFTTKIPTWVVAGSDTVISGTYTGPEYARITLQARNSPTSPWYAVSGYDFTDHTYRFAVPSRGTRQYRVAVGNTTSAPLANDAWFGGYSGPVTTTTQQKAVATPQSASTVAGSRLPVYLDVQPAVNGAATLQRWNGTTWTVVGNVQLSNGRATGIIHQTAVARVAYRYYVPAHTFNGLPVAAAYSQQFVLTTIR
jgi:hypothetical protein